MENEKLCALNEMVYKCSRCEISKLAVNAGAGKLKGCGDDNAKIMFIAQNPSVNRKEEGATDRVFGNPAKNPNDKLFCDMLEVLGVNREAVYVTNCVKCSSPENRVPTFEEARECSQYIYKEIKIINPMIIVAVGSLSSNLFHVELGKTSYLGEIPVFGIWHPSFILRRMQFLDEYRDQFKKLKDFISNTRLERRDHARQQSLADFAK